MQNPASARQPYWKPTPRAKAAPAAIGVAKRAIQRNEEAAYKTLEDLWRLHRLEWWHCTVAQRSQAGWPDYTIFGDGWHAWVELKARSPLTKRPGKVSDGQRRYQRSIEQSGGEWRTFCLPDDWDKCDSWLNDRTGHDIHTDGRLRVPEQAVRTVQE